MDRDQLYDYLDIEHGEQFEYFENFADLVEHEGILESDVIYELLEEVNMKTFAELCESYFYETLESVPGDQIDLYNLLESIKRVIVGLSEAVRKDEQNALIKLADELNRFRVWFSTDNQVECTNVINDSPQQVTVRDALSNSRLEKISKDQFLYDFSRALEYPIEEYIMTYGDLVED